MIRGELFHEEKLSLLVSRHDTYFFHVMTKQDVAIAAYRYFHSVNIKTTDDLFEVVQVGRVRSNRKK